MILSQELLDQLHTKLQAHFGVEVSKPKVRVIKDPQKFVDLYAGQHRERSMKNLIAWDSEVECYFNEDLKTIMFKGFRRDGSKSFQKLKEPNINIAQLVHEWVHHIQVQTNGYGELDFFDEACAEFVTYVLTGEVSVWADYWSFIIKLWNFLECLTSSPKKKYILIRDYNTNENKKELHDEWLAIFLNQHKRLKKTKRSLIQILEVDEMTDQKADKVLFKIDGQKVREEIYRLHDKFKLKLQGLT